jgi:hypothetical protein
MARTADILCRLVRRTRSFLLVLVGLFSNVMMNDRGDAATEFRTKLAFDERITSLEAKLEQPPRSNVGESHDYERHVRGAVVSGRDGADALEAGRIAQPLVRN